MYSDYDIEENKDGTWSAYQPDTSNRIVSAQSKVKLEQLMAHLGVAFSRGVVAGISEEKQRIREQLGLYRFS